MSVREYTVRGYRNTGYSSGVINETEFDRPYSQEVFETLYPDNDSDVVELQAEGTSFLMRSIYYKDQLKVTHLGTQKDILYQIDYLRIQAVNGGDNRECAYYFVDTSRTQFIGNDTAILYITLDEQTTANASQTVSMNGIIEKRNRETTENTLNWFPEQFTPTEPLETRVAYITAEDAEGYTVTSGISKTSGVVQFAAVYCDLGQLLLETPVVAPLPETANSVTFTIDGKNNTSFDVVVQNMALVDINNAQVKKALNKIRELGNEVMIGATYTIPKQCINGTPTTVTSNGIPLITAIHGGTFYFTIDNLYLIPSYGLTVQNKKALYQFTTYTLTAPSSGESKSYSLQEVIDSANSTANLEEGQLIFMGTGIPMSNGAIYWRPKKLSKVKPVEGYDKRISFTDAVRGSDWNCDGLTLTGQANAELLAQQLAVSKQQKSIDNKQIEKQLELTKANIDQARLASTLGMMNTGAGLVGNIITGNKGGIISNATSLLQQTGTRIGLKQDSSGAIGMLGDTYNRQEKLAEEQAELARQANALGLKSVQFSYDYAKNTQSLAVQPPTGLDMNRIMCSSLMVSRQALSKADVARFDLYLTWHGTTVQESYVGLLKEHEHMLKAGTDFSYIKLGLCTISLPNEQSGWGNTLAWRRKIQAEMQTGGRYWKKKILDYVWDVPIPQDNDYQPISPETEVIYFESLYTIGADVTTALKITLNKEVAGLSVDDITVNGATKGDLTNSGSGVYLLAVSGFEDGDTVTVSLSKEGYTFKPNSHSVTVSNVWKFIPNSSITNVVGNSALLNGLDITASCEIEPNHLLLLWGEIDCVVTEVKDNQHIILGSITLNWEVGHAIFFYNNQIIVGSKKSGSWIQDFFTFPQGVAYPMETDYWSKPGPNSYGNLNTYGTTVCYVSDKVYTREDDTYPLAITQGSTTQSIFATSTNEVPAIGCINVPPISPANYSANKNSPYACDVSVYKSTAHGYTYNKTLNIVYNILDAEFTGITVDACGALFNNGLFYSIQGVVYWLDDSTGESSVVPTEQVTAGQMNSDEKFKVHNAQDGVLTIISY